MTARLTQIPAIPLDIEAKEMPAVLSAMKQNIEILAGAIGDKAERPIKYGDSRIADLDKQQSAAAAGAAPTKAEFDLVVADITAMQERLNYLFAFLRGDPVGQ